jgi:hypothetical protein
MLRVSEGNVEEASQDLLACHRLGQLVARGGSLFELLVGLAIHAIVYDRDISFLEKAKTTSKQVWSCWDELREFPPMPAVGDIVDLGQRIIMLEGIVMAARHGPSYFERMSESNPTPPKDNRFTSRLFTQSIDWDPALRNVNRWFDRCAAIMRIADRTERQRELAAFSEDHWNLKQEATQIGAFQKVFKGPAERGEKIGKVYISLLFPAIAKVMDAADRGLQYQRNLNLAFALAAYRRDNGRYPDKLDELVPAHLKAIPDDLFSGKPLIYRPQVNGYLLYSVDINGIDEGGRGYADEPRGDDLSIRIPVPEPEGKK